MRLLIKFDSIKEATYNHDLHKLQGFVYSLIENTEYANLHDKQDRKYFCYSNIFPACDIKKYDIRKMMIDTPDENLYKVLLKSLMCLKKRQLVRIGDYSFVIDSIKEIYRNIKAGDWIETSTPIILRYLDKKNNRLFWGSNQCDRNIYTFMQNLENNLITKYSFYFGNTKFSDDIFCIERDFSEIQFVKITAYPLQMNGKTSIHIGSKWKFKVSKDVSEKTLRLLNFCFQTGFGEKCSMGFGFINKEAN